MVHQWLLDNEHGTDINKIFSRAFIKSALQDYNGSLDEYNRLAEKQPKNNLVYFNRANTNNELISLMNLLSDFNDNIIYIGNSQNKQEQKNSQKAGVKSFDDVIADYNKSIRLDSSFYYAYFNLANVEIDAKDYKSAISYFSKAIETEPKFAEAYFNRGLTYIYIKEKEAGCTDLSKAGELGVKSAYVIIKKYCDK